LPYKGEYGSLVLVAIRDLPPGSALRSFVSAARRGSFRAAASELGVSPSAISHQVRALEERIGAPLFMRTARSVSLTQAGERLLRDIGGALDAINEAIDRETKAATTRVLRISSLPLFTTVWLAPRLDRFASAHPEIAIEIESSNRIVDLEAENVDVAVRNADPGGDGYVSRKLLDLRARPLCATQVATTLKCPGDLANVTLIHISAGRAGWSDWLRLNGVDGLKPRSSLSFDSYPAAIEAAAKGRGVLLGLEPLVWDAPSAAELVAPFGPASHSAGAYFAVWRRSTRSNLARSNFIAWLFDEMKRDARRLSSNGRGGRAPIQGSVSRG
jgi:DNA-binding transcriptional LysR family regulator